MKYVFALVLICCVLFSAKAKSFVDPVAIDTVLSDENVTYKITEEGNYLNVHISTADEKTIMSILHLGVSVFFDIKGKKKQNVFIKYPSEAIRLKHMQPKRERGMSERIEEDDTSRRKKIKEILENDYPQKAEYGYFDDTEEFHLLLNNLDVSAEFVYDEKEGLFTYDLKIPKTKINQDAKKDLSKLSIGVKTVKAEREKNKDGGLNTNIGGLSLGGGQQGGGRSGGGGPPGGGKGGGQGSKGKGGGQGGPPPNAGSQNRPTDVLLDFWFKTNS